MRFPFERLFLGLGILFLLSKSCYMVLEDWTTNKV